MFIQPRRIFRETKWLTTWSSVVPILTKEKEQWKIYCFLYILNQTVSVLRVLRTSKLCVDSRSRTKNHRYIYKNNNIGNWIALSYLFRRRYEVKFLHINSVSSCCVSSVVAPLLSLHFSKCTHNIDAIQCSDNFVVIRHCVQMIGKVSFLFNFRPRHDMREINFLIPTTYGTELSLWAFERTIPRPFKPTLSLWVEIAGRTVQLEREPVRTKRVSPKL